MAENTDRTPKQTGAQQEAARKAARLKKALKENISRRKQAATPKKD